MAETAHAAPVVAHHAAPNLHTFTPSLVPISDLLLPEFDAEMATTRPVLERVPDERIQWKPHEKAFAMGHLAQLVAMIPGWTTFVVTKNEFDIAPKEGPSAVYEFQPVSKILALFDKSVADARPLIAGVTDASGAWRPSRPARGVRRWLSRTRRAGRACSSPDGRAGA